MKMLHSIDFRFGLTLKISIRASGMGVDTGVFVCGICLHVSKIHTRHTPFNKSSI